MFGITFTVTLWEGVNVVELHVSWNFGIPRAELGASGYIITLNPRTASEDISRELGGVVPEDVLTRSLELWGNRATVRKFEVTGDILRITQGSASPS